MTQQDEQLTFLEAASTVAGYGIGAGIMAVPYLALMPRSPRSGIGGELAGNGPLLQPGA